MLRHSGLRPKSFKLYEACAGTHCKLLDQRRFSYSATSPAGYKGSDTFIPQIAKLGKFRLAPEKHFFSSFPFHGANYTRHITKTPAENSHLSCICDLGEVLEAPTVPHLFCIRDLGEVFRCPKLMRPNQDACHIGTSSRHVCLRSQRPHTVCGGDCRA